MTKKTKQTAKTSDLHQEAQVAMASDQTITLGELSERYLKSLEEKGAGPGTIASYGMELKLAQKQLGSETPIGLFTVDRIAEYFASDAVMKTRAGTPKAPPTYLKSQRVLRLALAWAAEQKLIEAAPIPTVEPKA
ncbi:MAG: hypothetical protein L6Q99_16005 [Planctomycetes bacterium]|nr:hypothetical protein [Planctomycetota bacterium]